MGNFASLFFFCTVLLEIMFEEVEKRKKKTFQLSRVIAFARLSATVSKTVLRVGARDMHFFFFLPSDINVFLRLIPFLVYGADREHFLKEQQKKKKKGNEVTIMFPRRC